MNKIKIGIGFHGSVDFTHPASVSGIIINNSKILSQKGYIFNIFCDSFGKCIRQENKQKNINLFPFTSLFHKKNTKSYIWTKTLSISSKLANSSADVIHIHQKPEIVIGYYLFRNKPVPVIFHINNHPDTWKGSRWERAFRKSDLVIAASRFIKKSLIKKFPFLIGNIKVLYNGVDTKIFSPQKINNTLRTPKGLFTVFFAGNIWIEKGFDVLLKAAKELLKENVKFLIAGAFSPDTDNFHKKFEKNSPQNIKYLGLVKHDNLARYYATADIAIVPSRWEDPCPLVVMEAMACGTPVIGSRIGGIPELIDNEKNGLLVTPGSVEELIHAILWYKNHPERLKEIGIEARKKALSFDWKIISEQLEKFYEELLS